MQRRPNAMDVQVGQSIRAHRLIAGMSQNELGDHLGISFQQIQKYEKGKNRVGAGRLRQMADVFKVPVNALFEPHADTSAGNGTSAAPVKLVADRSTLKLLTAYRAITDRTMRRNIIQLIAGIAKSAGQGRKKKSRNGRAG
jgi:transcriptional regulator with XRE-family HTH domain